MKKLIRDPGCGTDDDLSDTFKVEGEATWRRLEDHPMPRPQAWVLKLVQAAVIGGTPSMSVRLLRNELIIDLPDLPLPPAQTLNDRLGDPKRDPDASLQAIKEALAGSKGDFRIDQGKQFGAFQARAQRYSYLPGQSQISGVQLRIAVRNATQRVELCHELRHYAFTSPIPLTLDKRRIDALQACPTHGYGKERQPFFLGAAQVDQPRFLLPPG